MITTHFFSASQITLYRDCQRKWGWKYLSFLTEPQSDAGKLGDAVDAGQLQPYLRAGTPFDYTRADRAGYIAASGLRHLPKPGTPGLEVQRWFQFPSPWSLQEGTAKWGYQGHIDLYLPNGGMPCAWEGVTVSDFKCTKDIDAYSLSEDELASDVQGTLYGTFAMHKTGAREIDLVWLYFSTGDTRKSNPVRVHVDAAHVLTQFQLIDETAAEMYELVVSAPKGDLLTDFVLDLPPNPQHCQKYGRPCAFTDRCNLSPDQIVEAMAAHERARRGKRPLPVINQASEGASPNMSATIDAIRARRAAALGQTPSAPPAPLPINPPESALPPAAPVGVAAPAPVAPPPAEAPKPRGRPRKPPVAEAPAPAPVAPPPAPPAVASSAITADAPDTDDDLAFTLGHLVLLIARALRAA